MKIKDFFLGELIITARGPNVRRFFNICRQNNIFFRNISFDTSCVSAAMKASDFKKIRHYAYITCTRVRISKKKGLPALIHDNRKRQFFLCGILLFFFINFIMSRYLWSIKVIGNNFYSDKEILEYINNLDVSYGSKIQEISCYDIERGIRNNFENITWVSAYLTGTRLSISIKEKEDEIFAQKNDEPYNIVANKNGIIHSIFTRKGTPLVKAGQEVSKDDVLVMSRVDSTDESEQIHNTTYVHADADIIMETKMDYSNSILRNHKEKRYTGRVKHSKAIKIADKVINYDITDCRFEHFDVISDYKKLNLYGDFSLPVTYIYTDFYEYEYVEAEYSDEELEELLTTDMNNYIKKLEENSIQIIQNSVKIDVSDVKGMASGTLVLLEAATRIETFDIINDQEETLSNEH